MELIKQYIGHNYKRESKHPKNYDADTENDSENKYKSKTEEVNTSPVAIIRPDTNDTRYFPISITTDNNNRVSTSSPSSSSSYGKRKFLRGKNRVSKNQKMPSINMSAFDFIHDREDKETAIEVGKTAIRALSKTGSVSRISVYESDYEYRIVVNMLGNPPLGADQIDAIRSSAIGKIRNVICSVYVPTFKNMELRYQKLDRKNSWQIQNPEEQPLTLGVETSVSIYQLRNDVVSAGEKIRREAASSEERVKKRSRNQK